MNCFHKQLQGFSSITLCGSNSKFDGMFAEIRFPNIDDHFGYSFDRTVFNILHPFFDFVWQMYDKDPNKIAASAELLVMQIFFVCHPVLRSSILKKKL